MLKKLPSSYLIACFLTFALLIVSIFNPDSFSTAVHSLNQSIFNLFGRFYLWFAYGTLMLSVGIALSPLGKIKIGGKNAKIEHSFFSWFSMLFCAGMGVGLLFWGGAEPLYLFLNPPIEGSITQTSKELYAFQFAFFHWGLHPWSIYGLTTLAICFYSMNLKRGIQFSSFLARTVTNRQTFLNKTIKFLVNNITVLAVLFGIIVSFGLGVLQFEGGLFNIMNIKQTTLLEVMIIIAITVCYMISTLRGLSKGIKVLSNISMILSFVLLGLVIFALPLKEIIEPMITSLPSYICSIPKLSLGNYNFADSNFLREWTIKYWAWWISWAPFVGIFVALISKGRSIRQLLIAMLITPTLFSILWFSVFGKAALILEQSQGLMSAGLNFNNINLVLYKIIEGLFSSPIISWLCLILVFIFFVNSADSATYTLAAISQKGNDSIEITEDNEIKIKEPSISMQTCWGITFSILTGLFLFLGGLELLHCILLIMVLPFSFLLCFVFLKLVYNLIRYYKKEYYR